MRERIIILGAGVMQGPAIRIAKELGFFTVVLDGSAAAPCIALADKFEQIDLKDKEGIESFARSLRDSGGGLGGIMTAGTDFSASVAWVAESLGLPGLPYEAALNASDKSRMRACFKTAGLPSPEFTVITEADLSNYQLTTATCSLVIKPVDNMGGRGCRRVDSMAEFHAAAADALSFSRSGRAIVETFMDGPEFSVDAIVYHGEITICGLADRHIFFPPYFIEMGHTMPTAIPGDQQQAILETFCAGIRALGLAGEGSIGAAKGDIKLTAKGPMIGEIAARLSGGYMSGWTYPYSSGVEPIRAAILAAMGRKPDGLIPLNKWTSAERAFISIPGTVQTVSGIETARSLTHVQDMFLRIAKGSTVSFPENNVSKCGNVISAAPEREAAIKAAENAVRSVLIRLDPEDQQTAAFLGIRDCCSDNDPQFPIFPPSAFQPTAELLAALEKLPETGGAGDMSIIPFPEFTGSGLRDYVGRSIGESLEAVRMLTGFSLPETPESSDNNRGASKIQPGFGVSGTLLGRSFWAALIRGGYQGATYYIDQLR
ncbi:MAG: ATP-grasp domain-containing protein [Treponema sp.]|jgi:biotin carboxylase|nr:ATP-grasp domain-containing protein [Treponema sp.]